MLTSPDKFDREELARTRQMAASLPFALDDSGRLLLDAVALMIARTRRAQERGQRELIQKMRAFTDPQIDSYWAIPSCQILEFEPDVARAESGVEIAAGETVLELDANGVAAAQALEFRVTRNTPIWPIAVVRSSLIDRELKLTLEITHPDQELTFADFENMTRLPIFLHGPEEITFPLYEAMLTAASVQAGPLGSGACIQVRPGGFGSEEALLPRVPRVLAGDRWLTEFLIFPEKFLFVELGGLDGVVGNCGRTLEVRFELNASQFHLANEISPKNFRLNCAPAVNLIQTDRTMSTVLHRSGNVFNPNNRPTDDLSPVMIRDVSVNDVLVPPLYLQTPATGVGPTRFWSADLQGDDPTVFPQVLLRVTNLGDTPVTRESKSKVRVSAWSCQGDRPHMAERGLRWQLCRTPGAAQTLVGPTSVLRPPIASQTLTNQSPFSSIPLLARGLDGDGVAGAERLRQVLANRALLDWPCHSDAKTRERRQRIGRLVQGVRQLSASVARSGAGTGPGRLLTLHLDESACPGSSGFLLGNILEKLFECLAPIGSFSQLKLHGPGGMHLWPARTGDESHE